MDEKHWGDPKEFRPERFINDRGEYVEDPWLISFGLGIKENTYIFFVIQIKYI